MPREKPQSGPPAPLGASSGHHSSTETLLRVDLVHPEGLPESSPTSRGSTSRLMCPQGTSNARRVAKLAELHMGEKDSIPVSENCNSAPNAKSETPGRPRSIEPAAATVWLGSRGKVPSTESFA